MNNFAKRLKELREERGLSLNKLSKQVGFSRVAIARWESNENIPNLEVLCVLADFFKVTADYLLGREN